MLKREIKKIISEMEIGNIIFFSSEYIHANSITQIRVSKVKDGFTLYDSGENFYDQEPTWKQEEKDVVKWVWEEKPYKVTNEQGMLICGLDY